MIEPRRKPGGAFWTAMLVSIAVHLALIAAVIPALRPSSDVEEEAAEDEAQSEEPDRLNVKMVAEREEPDPPDARDEKQERTEREQKREKNKKEKQETEEEQKKQKQKEYNRKAVVQETNEESPDEAQFVSETANVTEEEMRAREASEEFVEPSKTSADKKKREVEEEEETPEEKLGSKAMASAESTKPKPPPPKAAEPKRERRKKERRESEDRPAREAPESEGPKPSKKMEKSAEESGESDRKRPPLPMPRPGDYDEVFDAEADQKRREEHAEKGVGHDMFRRIEQSDGSVRAAMENYIPEVKPGNHTSVNAHADKAATYVNRIHSKIHPRWGGTYLPHLDSSYGPGHELSNPNLNTVLEFVIDGESGELESVTIVSSSGVSSYDMEAVLIAKHVAPHTKPPEEIVSPDGDVYMHWNFWRDQRQCGTFGVNVYKVDEGGGEGEKSPG